MDMRAGRRTGRRWMYAAAPSAALGLLLIGCGEDNDVPRTSRVVVEGTAPASLQLITATDFVEVLDESTGAVEAVLLDSDTLEIDLPFESDHALTGDPRFLVRLTNFEDEVADVRLRIYLDAELAYDQAATLSEVASLEYRYRSRNRGG